MITLAIPFFNYPKAKNIDMLYLVPICYLLPIFYDLLFHSL